MRFTLTNETRVLAATDPQKFQDTVRRFLDRAALEVQRDMRRRAPKAFSTLANSIHITHEAESTRLVSAGVHYARAVEEGTGPAAGKARYFPDPTALMPWVKFRSRIAYTQSKPGTPGRRAQLDEVRDRAWRLARFISKHGTQPQPFVAPTAQGMADRVVELLRQGVREALRSLPGTSDEGDGGASSA